MIETIEQLQEYSINQLIVLMNEKVLSMKQTSTSASGLRSYIESEISSMFGGKIEASSGYTDSRDITISHPNMFFGLTFKLSTKSTGEIQKITKLKSAYVKKPGKVKFDNFYFRFSMPCYLYDEKTKKGSIDPKWTTSGEHIHMKAKDLDMDMKIGEMNSKESLISIVEKAAIEKNGSLKEYVMSSAFQPWIKKFFFDKKAMDKYLKPYAKKHDIDMSDDNWPWHAALKAYEENNPEMVQTTLDWIIKDSLEERVYEDEEA